MQRLSAFATASLLALTFAQAQTSDIVIFSDAGEKFTLLIDGDEKNTTPATRVVAPGIRNETPMIIVKFADAAVPPIKQNGWMQFGKEYTLRVTTNKKGEHVLRMQGEAALGTAASAAPDKPAPTNFVDDSQRTGTTSGGNTTTIRTETTAPNGQNINVGVNGMGVNMNMSVNDGMGGTTTTTTTTTTMRTNINSDQTMDMTERPATKPSYTMPGYSGPVGCDQPMSAGEFSDAKASIDGKGFEESKMTLAKQIAGGHCLSVDQVKGIMGLFGFEESKLDFAKFAYDHTFDRGNYYKVNDAFGFESSIQSLNDYIKGR